MSTPNPRTIAPNLPFPERGQNVVDVKLAENTRRQGPRLAEEGLGWEQPYPGAFHESVMKTDDAANHMRYETQVAGQANGRGRLGSGQEVPAWARDRAALAGFIQGNHVGDYAATLSPPPFQPRAGANPGTLSPIGSLVLGERPGNVVNKIQAPDRGGRGRSNPAAVFGSEDV